MITYRKLSKGRYVVNKDSVYFALTTAQAMELMLIVREIIEDATEEK